ncbi:hypothetical protein CDAR_575251 [Caerostris darwini]|uniref:Uncharacterized protein n=1 Tax=Caerostris darwini TaxID=1538125 RepID=A0AAV4MW51_9ARAC|nr:hypothetical protein CDAR_575251 [Caerostris darwini]
MTVRGAQSGRRRRNSVRAGVLGEKPRQLDQQAAVKGAHGLLRIQPTGEPTNLKGGPPIAPSASEPSPARRTTGTSHYRPVSNKPGTKYRMAHIARWTRRNISF